MGRSQEASVAVEVAVSEPGLVWHGDCYGVGPCRCYRGKIQRNGPQENTGRL